MQRLALMMVTVLSLTACGTWFGAKQAPPLPGERVAVLLHERQVTADPEAAATTVQLPPPSPTSDWPQAGGYANHAMHHLEVGGDLKRVWKVDIGRGAGAKERLNATPVVAEGRIFVMDAETVVSAFDTENGNRLWRAELTPDDEDDDHISGGLAYDDGYIFVTTGFAEVIALDAVTGAEIWREHVGAPMRTAPTARGGRLFVVTIDNKLYALNAATGESLWTHSGTAESASLLGGGSPAVDAGIVVVPYSSGELVALNVSDGRKLWTDSLASVRRTDVVSSIAHIRGRPVIDRGMVIAISHGGQMAAIELRSGRRIWDNDIGGLESPWVAGSYVFTITNDGDLLGLSRDDGRIHWVRPLPRWKNAENKTGIIIWTGPVLASDRLIVAGSQGQALTVSPYTGRILGVEEMPDSVTVAPIIADRSIYFLSDNAELVAYR